MCLSEYISEVTTNFEITQDAVTLSGASSHLCVASCNITDLDQKRMIYLSHFCVRPLSHLTSVIVRSDGATLSFRRREG